MTTADAYIKSLESTLARHFAPDQIYHGKSGALRLAREVGYGLASFPKKEVDHIIGSLYSRLLVRFTMATGVPMDARPWIAELKKEINRNQGKCIKCGEQAFKRNGTKSLEGKTYALCAVHGLEAIRELIASVPEEDEPDAGLWGEYQHIKAQWANRPEAN